MLTFPKAFFVETYVELLVFIILLCIFSFIQNFCPLFFRNRCWQWKENGENFCSAGAELRTPLMFSALWYTMNWHHFINRRFKKIQYNSRNAKSWHQGRVYIDIDHYIDIWPTLLNFFFSEFSEPGLLPPIPGRKWFPLYEKKLFRHTVLCNTAIRPGDRVQKNKKKDDVWAIAQLCTAKLIFSYSKIVWRLEGVASRLRKIKTKETLVSWTKGQLWPKGQICS